MNGSQCPRFGGSGPDVKKKSGPSCRLSKHLCAAIVYIAESIWSLVRGLALEWTGGASLGADIGLCSAEGVMPWQRQRRLPRGLLP